MRMRLFFYLCLFIQAATLKASGALDLKLLSQAVYNNPKSVIQVIDSVFQQDPNLNQKLKGELLEIKGKAYKNKGESSKAIEAFAESNKLFTKINFKEGEVASLNNIATVHINLQNYTKAEKYLVDALAIVDSNDLQNQKALLGNLALVYDYLGNPKKAIKIYEQSVQIAQKTNDQAAVALLYHNIAVCYGLLSDFKQSEQYELKALEVLKNSQRKDLFALIKITLGSLYLETGKINEAEQYLSEGGNLAKEINAPYTLIGFYQNMANLYITKNKAGQAVDYMNKLIALKDSLNTGERNKAATEAEAKFQLTLKNRAFELLKAEKLLSDEKIEKAKQWRIGLSIIVALSLIVLVVLFRNHQLNIQKNKLLKLEKQMVELEKKSLEEKNLMLENENIIAQYETLKNQISPHFLFNSLNVLSSLIDSDREKAKQFTNAFSKLFRTSLELKDRHLITVVEELKHVKAYIQMQKMRFDENLKVIINIDTDAMHQYLPPFSLQLVVENAIKHNIVTGENPLIIDIRDKDNFLMVSNNLQPRNKPEDSTKTGIANIKSRYKLICDIAPEFKVENNNYIVKLPLISEND